jgi:hypothetical protein
MNSKVAYQKIEMHKQICLLRFVVVVVVVGCPLLYRCTIYISSMGNCMISIVYGSLVAGLPNNQDAFVGGHGRHFAQYLRTGSTNYGSPLSFSRVNLK